MVAPKFKVTYAGEAVSFTDKDGRRWVRGQFRIFADEKAAMALFAAGGFSVEQVSVSSEKAAKAGAPVLRPFKPVSTPRLLAEEVVESEPAEEPEEPRAAQPDEAPSIEAPPLGAAPGGPISSELLATGGQRPPVPARRRA